MQLPVMDIHVQFVGKFRWAQGQGTYLQRNQKPNHCWRIMHSIQTWLKPAGNESMLLLATLGLAVLLVLC